MRRSMVTLFLVGRRAEIDRTVQPWVGEAVCCLRWSFKTYNIYIDRRCRIMFNIYIKNIFILICILHLLLDFVGWS